MDNLVRIIAKRLPFRNPIPEQRIRNSNQPGNTRPSSERIYAFGTHQKGFKFENQRKVGTHRSVSNIKQWPVPVWGDYFVCLCVILSLCRPGQTTGLHKPVRTRPVGTRSWHMTRGFRYQKIVHVIITDRECGRRTDVRFCFQTVEEQSQIDKVK